MQTKVVLIRRHGGADVLEYVSQEVGEPQAGQVRVRQSAIGLNYADIYQRQGEAGPHKTGTLPVVLGSQGAGVIEALGPGVSGLAVGDEVAYIHPGAYAQHVLVPADRVLPIGPVLTADLAAAFLLRGLTAEYLLHRLYAVQPGDPILVHAAAGGMGEVLCQWARNLGARVIGTVGSPGKTAVAQRHGCHEVLSSRDPDMAAKVLELTDGKGVKVVYDAVGKDVFLPSLDCLAPRGIAINFGTASGNVQAFDLQLLHAKSLSVCRPTLRTFIERREDLLAAAGRFTDAVAAGAIRLAVDRVYPLEEVRRAHIELESRNTVGAAVLRP